MPNERFNSLPGSGLCLPKGFVPDPGTDPGLGQGSCGVLYLGISSFYAASHGKCFTFQHVARRVQTVRTLKKLSLLYALRFTTNLKMNTIFLSRLKEHMCSRRLQVSLQPTKNIFNWRYMICCVQ